MTFRPWQGASRCTSGPQPGSAALQQAILENFGPEGAMNWGIYNCRTVRGGSTTSCHGEGRAGDVGFALGDPDGDVLRKILVDKAWALGIQCVIYERVIYSALSPGGRPYTGVAPHYDHIHWEHAWVGANNLTLARARRVLREGLEDQRPAPERRPVVDLSNARRAFTNQTRPQAVVKKIQVALNKEFPDRDPLTVDGWAGSGTRNRYEAYEERIGAPKPDGRPGSASLSRLAEEHGLRVVE